MCGWYFFFDVVMQKTLVLIISYFETIGKNYTYISYHISNIPINISVQISAILLNPRINSMFAFCHFSAVEAA